jgi:hypothetical protein
MMDQDQAWIHNIRPEKRAAVQAKYGVPAVEEKAAE